MYASMLRMPGDLLAQFDTLQRQMEHALGLRGAASIRGGGRDTFPAINMGTTPDAIEVYAFVPGVDPASLDVSIDKGLLSISGERAAGVPQDGVSAVYARERFAGKFKRVIALPDDADPAQVTAKADDGVLRITIRKLESSKPRRIDVQ
ncbi:Hsp20/alpha crystallin family protein [Achromobacter sp. GG226]|uniref:Hsp20/alpha crystallin family protein n=1 Tax=Verticiella alkaliphila TaxID=2779529 RepID=UPI001C0ACA51|nr:Hsp20/alpha crystallin family protein [Verticiella sp. GG226]MBU4612582.1 Hsp20/alpha crystallin family protein [Verticiella sp. GG226]